MNSLESAASTWAKISIIQMRMGTTICLRLSAAKRQMLHIRPGMTIIQRRLGDPKPDDLVYTEDRKRKRYINREDKKEARRQLRTGVLDDDIDLADSGIVDPPLPPVLGLTGPVPFPFPPKATFRGRDNSTSLQPNERFARWLDELPGIGGLSVDKDFNYTNEYGQPYSPATFGTDLAATYRPAMPSLSGAYPLSHEQPRDYDLDTLMGGVDAAQDELLDGFKQLSDFVHHCGDYRGCMAGQG
jgi:hypothetical protein